MAKDPPYRVKNMMPGMIMLWAGAVVDIPSGWHLCDGTVNTPDLTDCFVIGAGDTYAPDQKAATNVAANAGICMYALCFIMKLPIP